MINVKDIMEGPSVRFFQDPGLDTVAAAERLAVTDRCFSEWLSGVNAVKTRDIPGDLVEQYDRAADAICRIKAMEKAIIMKGGKR